MCIYPICYLKKTKQHLISHLIESMQLFNWSVMEQKHSIVHSVNLTPLQGSPEQEQSQKRPKDTLTL